MSQHYQTKYKLDTAVAIIFIFVGTVIISTVFGMMLFPVFTHVCAEQLLLGVARIGYGGIAVAFIGVCLEAYNLYEMHKQHVAVVMAASIVGVVITSLMIHYLAQAYSCTVL
ncbi:MAG: hypothetical protein WCV88_01070 [Patescibacteria group bacterium]|jgi:hypothetical protein